MLIGLDCAKKVNSPAGISLKCNYIVIYFWAFENQYLGMS